MIGASASRTQSRRWPCFARTAAGQRSERSASSAPRAPTITAGYWNDSDATYRSKLGGYWLTGDLVYQDTDGNYFQVDRASDAIETEEGGTGYSVLMEEMLLSDIAEIQDCAVVAGGFHDRTVPVVVVTIGESEVAAEKLLTRANEVLQAAGHPRIAVLEIARTPEEFPVGVTGKVLKRQLREKYRQLADYLQQEDRILAATGLEMPETGITD